MDNFGDVYIKGFIGNDYNPDGSIKEKGVELIDVMEQVAALGEVDGVNFWINSPGGNVNVGNQIGDFIATVPNAYTIAHEQCASIATRIHTSVALQFRQVQEGCQYMIHNPWGTVTGDSETMASAASAFSQVEKELEAHYAKATGVSKESISALMAVETYLTPAQCISLKFAADIVLKPTLRAVATIQTDKYNNMNKPEISFAERMKNAMAALKGEVVIPATPEATAREVKAVMIETDKGTIETAFEDVQVGDAVLIEGEVAEDGTYTVSGGEFIALEGETLGTGTVIEVMDGVISAISAEVTEEAENMEALNAKLVEVSEQLNALKAENEALKAEATTNAALVEEFTVQMEALAKIDSSFVAPKAQAQFRKVEPTAPKDLKAEMAARKAEYKKK